MKKAKIKPVSFDSTDVITASTPEVFNNGLFTFSGFQDHEKGNGLIKGDWENKHYEITNGNYESPFTADTTVEGGFKQSDQTISLVFLQFFDYDNMGVPISNDYTASGDGEFIFDGTSFNRKQ